MVNPQTLIDSHDLTVYPDGIENYDQVQQYETYDNSEFDSEENHARTIQGLRKLEKFNNENGRNEIFIISFNESGNEIEIQPIRKLITGMDQEPIYNFMFDYAVTGITQDDEFWIHYHIMKYRNEKIDDDRTDRSWMIRKMLHQIYFGKYLDDHKIAHIRGIFS